MTRGEIGELAETAIRISGRRNWQNEWLEEFVRLLQAKMIEQGWKPPEEHK